MTKQSFSYGATDAFSYDTEDLLETLQGVARGKVPVRDVEASQDPSSWGLAFAADAARTLGAAALSKAVIALFESESEADTALGRSLHMALPVSLGDPTPVVGVAPLWAVFWAHMDADRSVQAGHALSCIVPQVFHAPSAPSARVKTLVATGTVSEPILGYLLKLIGVGDRDWLVAHPEVLISTGADGTRLRIAKALGGLSSDALESTFADLVSAFAAQGHPMAPDVAPTIQRMVDARRKAGL